jgi:CHAT domain-containing protein
VLLFVLTQERGLAIHGLPRIDLKDVEQFAQLIRTGRSAHTFDSRGYRTLAWKIYQTYLQPAGLTQQEMQRLIIVPDGPFARIPFEALLSRPVPELEDADLTEALERLPLLFRTSDICYAPSATSLLKIRRSREASARSAAETEPDLQYLVLADPVYEVATPPDSSAMTNEVDWVRGADLRKARFAQLPHSRAEAHAIAAMAGEHQAQLYTGYAATEEVLKTSDLRQFDRIHIAAHAHLDEETPLLSALVLTQDDDPKEDGFLNPREIYDLRLDADLVVLSSCETAMGKSYRGEGVVALARPFLAVGARTTLVTLWPVNDFSTASWMRAFYTSLTRGDTKEEAMREARESMLRADRPLWRLPYYWAPFIMVGDYR